MAVAEHRLASEKQSAPDWMSSLVDASPDFVVRAACADGRLIYLNDTARRWLGVPPGASLDYPSFAGSLWSDEESARRAVEGWSAAGERGECAWEASVLDRSQNVRRPVQCRLVSVDGGLVLTLRDVSERRAAESKSAELEEEFKRFAYLVSHDLKEPLRMISSYLQLIRKRMPPAAEGGGQQSPRDVEEFMGFAVDGAKRLGALLDALLQYSRIDAGPSDFEWTEADTLLTRALGSVEPALQEAGGQLVRRPLPRVYTVPKLLTGVFQHLLSNAVRFRAEARPESRSSRETPDRNGPFRCATTASA